MSMPRYKKIFTSYSLEDCKEKIEYATDLFERMRDMKSLRADLPELTIENKQELKFSNGSRLISVFTPRGKARADIDCDEFSHYENDRKIYKAAVPIIRAGGRLCVMGTPTHSQRLFARIGRREGGKFIHFKRARIFWYDSPLHCIDVTEARRRAPGMPTLERVRSFGTETLQEQFDNMLLEDFQQEFELSEQDDEASFLSFELILSCTPSGEDEGGTMLEINRCDTIGELKKKTGKRVLFAGYDVGRRRDSSVLSVFEVNGGRVIERYLHKLTRVGFDAQEAEIEALMSISRCLRIEIDETGLGMQLAENMKKKFGHRVVPISFTSASKAEMSSNMKMMMQRGSVRFIADRDANMQMHSVKKTITSAGNLTLTVNDQSDADAHHADIFWSRALALHAFHNKNALPKPRVLSLDI